jgi:hypothetical protein
MEGTSDANKGPLSRKTRKAEEKEASQAERDEQYRAAIEPDPILEEVGEANEKIDQPSERRRIIPSKPC